MVSGCARGSLGWILGKKFFTETVVKHRNRLSGEVVKSPSLEGFKSCVDMVLGWDVV